MEDGRGGPPGFAEQMEEKAAGRSLVEYAQLQEAHRPATSHSWKEGTIFGSKSFGLVVASASVSHCVPVLCYWTQGVVV